MEALTDERVLYRRAPFDHPQLFVPNGHPGDSSSTVDADGDGLADDLMIEIPAVGAAGGNPLPGFLEGIFAMHNWKGEPTRAVPDRGRRSDDRYIFFARLWHYRERRSLSVQ